MFEFVVLVEYNVIDFWGTFEVCSALSLLCSQPPFIKNIYANQNSSGLCCLAFIKYIILFFYGIH